MPSYKDFFGLQGAPFTKLLSPAAILTYSDLALCFGGLHTLVEDGGMGLLVGEMGMGKTTAVRTFATTLDPARVRVSYLPSAEDNRSLLRKLALGLGLTPAHLTSDLRIQLGEYLLSTYRRQACRTLLLADEAHLYNEALLTEIRLLTQLGMDHEEPLVVLLIGQPPLRKQLRRTNQATLRQRVTFHHSLVGISRAETTEYVAAHLRAVGGEPAIFPQEVVDWAWREAQGVPRALNQLLNQALQKAAWKKENPVSLETLEAVLAWVKEL